MHCVDLGESFSVSPHVPFLNLLFEQIAIPTSIYLQNLASVQPRTSPRKFRKMGIWDFEISFAFSPVLAFEIRGQQTLNTEPIDPVVSRTITSCTPTRSTVVELTARVDASPSYNRYPGQ